MTTKQSILMVLLLVAMGGCAASIPVEGPICLPERPVLENISIEDQRWLHAERPLLLQQIGTNDATLKSTVRLLEGLILAHDEPLGSCD
jgi:hypothetical protein